MQYKVYLKLISNLCTIIITFTWEVRNRQSQVFMKFICKFPKNVLKIHLLKVKVKNVLTNEVKFCGNGSNETYFFKVPFPVCLNRFKFSFLPLGCRSKCTEALVLCKKCCFQLIYIWE